MNPKKHALSGHPTQAGSSATQEQQFQRKYYWVIIGLLVFAAVYYYFIQPKTIGHDARYEIFIVWVPVISGMIVLAFYRRQFLLKQFAAGKDIVYRIIMVLFYVVQGALFSYFSIGQVAEVGWDIVNYKVANASETITIECPVSSFETGKKSNSVGFIFNNKYDHIYASYSQIAGYLDKGPNNYVVNIKAQKGIWNYYLVKSWSIREK